MAQFLTPSSSLVRTQAFQACSTGSNPVGVVYFFGLPVQASQKSKGSRERTPHERSERATEALARKWLSVAKPFKSYPVGVASLYQKLNVFDFAWLRPEKNVKSGEAKHAKYLVKPDPVGVV